MPSAVRVDAAISKRAAATGVELGALPMAFGQSISRCQNASCSDSSSTSWSRTGRSGAYPVAPAAASAAAAAAPCAPAQTLYNFGTMASASTADLPPSRRAATIGRVERTVDLSDTPLATVEAHDQFTLE